MLFYYELPCSLLIYLLMNYSSQVSKNRMYNIILKCQRDNHRPLLCNRIFQMVIKKLIYNMFRMDMCDNICHLIIVPRRVPFTSEHRTSKTEQSDPGWWLLLILPKQSGPSKCRYTYTLDTRTYF